MQNLGNGKYSGASRIPSKAGKMRPDRKLLERLAGEGEGERQGGWEGGKRERMVSVRILQPKRCGL